jgi:outer membrane protein TolC
MFRSPLLFSAPLVRAMVPLLGLTLLPAITKAGNQNGPGWQQHNAKPKSKSKSKSPPVGTSPIIPGLPAEPGEAVRRLVPTEEMVERRIPGNGPLYEDELIRLAIANHPDLARRRAEVLIAHAKVKGAGDWENPELRIGYVWDHDDRIREPFLEESTERISASESYRQTDSLRSLDGPLQPREGDATYERTSGSVNTSRYRTIERRVTPGRYRDIVETTVSERRSSREKFGKNTTQTSQGATFGLAEAGSQNTDRRIVERSREVINHPDEYSRDDQLSLLIRFRVPNPWERRAKIEIAAAETERAESDYLIEEDKVVRTVRAMYEDLNMTESAARGTAGRRSLQEKFGQEIEAANLPDLADLAADVRLEVGKARRDEREYRSDIARLREELATYCGLDRPERIGVLGKPTRRLVPIASLDVGYLISMAQLHRSDLLDLKARLAVAKAELRGAKAAKIPFFTFIDGGWSTSQTSGRTGESEEWEVRVGVSLPLFDWIGLNKAHLEHETATAVYSKQIEQQTRLIEIEIRQAMARISAANVELGRYESDLALIKADSAKSLAQTAVDPIKSLKTRYQTEDLVSKFEEDRFEVWSDYYKAVMELERALGTRLERVLTR